jgi:hypothetical protein
VFSELPTRLVRVFVCSNEPAGVEQGNNSFVMNYAYKFIMSYYYKFIMLMLGD